jgi:hypothetical protein
MLFNIEGIPEMPFFYHPDYTVGSGVSPNQPFGSRALPPVRNFTCPQRVSFEIDYIIL